MNSSKQLLLLIVLLVLIALFFGCSSKASYCESRKGMAREMCYSNEAALNQDPALCYNIESENYRNFCILGANDPKNALDYDLNDTNYSAVQTQTPSQPEIGITIHPVTQMPKDAEYTFSAKICNNSTNDLNGVFVAEVSKNISFAGQFGVNREFPLKAHDCKVIYDVITPTTAGEGTLTINYKTQKNTYSESVPITVQ